ncbi:MAG: hypothetical protein FWD85_00075 [Microbacteriaceae bacterium]|nr:hypothetical protein [Microbacteriaceae bacterium]MCL2793679.1 hypothetical protein [Microbacteriaceae bacterium]
MNPSNLRRALLRRWYVAVPGLLASVALALAAHVYVQPTFTRTASVVLIPDQASIPQGANPYLYVGGLTQAADILVRAAGAQAVTEPILDRYPRSSITIERDTTTAGPVIDITVEAASAADTGPLISQAVVSLDATLAKLQIEEHLSGDRMITASELSEDTKATPKTKSQLMATVGAGIAGLAITLALASFLDGVLLARPRRGGRRPARSRKREEARAGSAPAERAAGDDDAEPEVAGQAASRLPDRRLVRMPTRTSLTPAEDADAERLEHA